MLFRDLLDFGAQNWRWLVITIPAALAFIAAFIFVSTKNFNDKKTESQATDKQSIESKLEASHSEDKKPDDSEPKHEKLPRFVLIATMTLIIALVLYVIIVIGAFVEHFHQRGLQPDFDKWGQVGDFFGGMLNPILAFASFIALLYTINLQSKEMQETRTELKQSRIAQQKLVRQAENEQQNQRNQERYKILLTALTDSNDRIKHMLEQPFSTATPDSMPSREKRPADIANWGAIRKTFVSGESLNMQFEAYISTTPALFEHLLTDIKPILRESRRLKVIATDFEAICLAMDIFSDQKTDGCATTHPTNFDQLMLKDSSLNLKRARRLSEIFDAFTLPSFTPEQGSLLEKFGNDSL